MALSLATDLAPISLCESVDSWSGSPVVDGVQYVEGNYSLSIQVKSTTGLLHTRAFSGNMVAKAIFMALWVNGLTDTKANGGYRGYAAQGANTGLFYLGGGGVHAGRNFFCFCPGSTPTTPVGTIDESAIDTIGLQFKVLTSAVGTIKNCFWDAVRYGSYLQCTSGVSDAFGLEDIVALDLASAYGVMLMEASGTIVQQAGIIFGNVSSGSCDFSETGKTWVFPNNTFVEDGFYYINVVGNSGGTTNFVLSRVNIESKGIGFNFDSTDADNDTVSMEGGSMVNASSVKLGTAQDFHNIVFDSCGLIEPGTADFTNNTISNASNRGVKLTASHITANNKYLNNSKAILVDTASTITLDGDYFNGNTYDIENSSTGLVTIICTNGANPSEAKILNSGGGSTVIVNNVIFELTNVVSGSSFYAYNVTDSIVLITARLITTDPFQVTVPANKAFWANISKATGSPIYEPEHIVDNTGSGFSRRIEQKLDS